LLPALSSQLVLQTLVFSSSKGGSSVFHPQRTGVAAPNCG
jgi:hypothetical protein